GFGSMNRFHQFGCRRDSFRLDVDDLSADHTWRDSGIEIAKTSNSRVYGHGDVAQDLHYCLRWNWELRDGLKRKSLECIAGQDCGGLSERHVAGGFAPPKIIV